MDVSFLGSDVVEFRRRRGLSRKALATSCGLTEGKIWRIENKGKISDEERRALQLVGVTPLGEDAGDAASTPPKEANVPRPAPTPPVALFSANEPWSELRDIPPSLAEVNFSELIKVVDKKYDRYFSNSELRTFKRCRRKWWLAWNRGLRLKKESPVGVRQVGTRLHLALKAHYTPASDVASHGDMLAELERLIVLDRTQLEGESEEVVKQFEKEADLERIMLEGYVQWLAETGADAELEVVAAETYVEAGLPEFDDQVAIIGKMDVRVRRLIDNVRMFIDHKSVASVTQPVSMLPLDEQMLHYHLLESLTLEEGDPRSDGALYNMLKRVKRTSTAKPPFYSRVEVRHNGHELDSYRRRMVGTISDILEVEQSLTGGHAASHQTVAYSNPTRDCTWDCQFIAVCPMFDDGSRVEAMLEEHYTTGDPLDYYQNEVIGGTE